MRRLQNALCAMVLCALTGCVHFPPVPDMSGAVSSPALEGRAPPSATVPVLLDDRMYVEVTFLRPDGTPRKALAFVNMGSGALILSNALFRELAPKPGSPLHMQFGTMDIAVDASAVQPETMANYLYIDINPFAQDRTAHDMAQGPGGLMASMGAPLKVEAILPPGLLEHFQVVFDYGAKTMTLAAPGTIKPEGIVVPIRVNPKTGFATLDATIAGKSYPFVIDNGGSFSAARDVGPWLEAHPDWLRSTGAIGPSNIMMSPDGYGVGNPVLEIPNVSFGALPIERFGVVRPGPQGWLGDLASGIFWDRVYSGKAGEDTFGWIGGNVLKSFRLTVDYPNRMTYWLQEASIDTHDLDQVGVVLGRAYGVTTIVGVAQKDGVPSVSGVESGDKLLKISNADTSTLTRGQLITALHGKPGEHKKLVLERAGKQIEVEAAVTGF